MSLQMEKVQHVASQLQQEGLLITNEIYPQRAKILSQNIDAWELKMQLWSRKPTEISKTFPFIFQCIVVDAPC